MFRTTPPILRRRGVLLRSLGLVFTLAVVFALAPYAQSPTPINLATARWGHTATALPGGRVFVAGGTNQNGPLGSTEILDFQASQTTAGPALLTPRADHTATRLANGFVLIAGGSGASGPLASTEFFDPTTGSIVAGPPMTTARSGQSATVLTDGRVLFVGGDTAGSAEVYQPSTGAFVPVAALTTPRSFHGAALLIDGRVMVAGGVGASGAAVASVEIFDPQAGTFTPVSDAMLTARVHPLVKVLPDGKVQIIGGDNGFTLEMFDPDFDIFRALVSLPPLAGVYDATVATDSRRALLSSAIAQNANVASAYFPALDRDRFASANVGTQAVVVGGINSAAQALASTVSFPASAATLTTDWLDYAPGSAVAFSGTGWTPGETVTIFIHEVPQVRPDTTLTVIADASGHISNWDFAVTDVDLGAVFTATATGSVSGSAAQTAFADAKALTVTKAGNGTGTVTGTSPVVIACGPTCVDNNLNNNQSVTLTAAADPGSTFTGWSFTSGTPGSPSAGCSSAGTTCTFGMNNNAITVQATFTKPTSTTAVSSSGTPSTYGQSVTFTATVSGSSGTPTGTVTFGEGGSCPSPTTVLASGVALNGSGIATFSTASLPAVAQTMLACYSGSTTYAASSGSVLQTVNPVALTVTGITANNKVYDGTTAATLNLGSAALQGVLAGDVGSVTLNTGTATGAFADKTVANGKIVTVTGLTLTGAKATNYTLTPPTTTANITPLALTVTGISASNKTYDGTTVATLSTGGATLHGVLAGDVVTLNAAGAAGAFANKNVGTAKPVTVTGLALAGTDAANYTLTPPAPTANITAKALTVSGVSAASKVYDGTTTATLSTSLAALVGVVAGDVVTLNTGGATGTFSDKTVGAGKVVTISGVTIGGADGANYAVTQPTTTADITTKTVTVTGVTASDKVYDGTTNATVNFGSAALVGVVSGDHVNLVTTSGTGAFADKTVGTNKTVTISGLKVTGPDSGNYLLTQPSTTASITAKPLTVTGITANNKVYDGTTTATLNTSAAALGGVISGDTVTLNSGSASGTFADKNVGTGKTVTISGLTLGGTDAGNYTLGAVTTTANITPKPLTVTGLTASSKVYDGTTTATLNTGAAALAGVISPDVVTLNTAGASGSFADKNVGAGKTVTISGLTLGGADAGNYSLTQPTTAADITAKPITVSGITANNKVYDGNTTAALSTGAAALTGVVSGDTVTLNSGSAAGTFADKNVGTGKTVTISGLTLGGTDAGNYSLTQPTAKADITARPITATGITANNKVYDGTTTATLNTGTAALTGVISGDNVTLNSASAGGAFADKNVGTGRTVAISGLTLGGTDAGNYSLTQPTATADITAKPVTVSGITASNKIYDGTTTATLSTGAASLVGAIAGDVVSLNTASVSGTFGDKNVGTGKTVTISGVTLGGTDAGNYSLTQPTAKADITAKPLTASGVTANNKVYDGNTTATLNTSAAALTGVVSGDTVTLNSGSASGAFADKNVGTGKTVTISGLTLGGADSGNYALSQPTATADITAKPITVSGITAGNKVYDGTTTATLNTAGAALVGTIGGDVVSLNTAGASATFADKNVGTGKTVTVAGLALSGADSGNYALSQPTAAADITAKPISASGVTANNKVYDGSTAATLNTGAAALVGTLAGDVVSLNIASVSGTFADKNVGIGKTVTVAGLALGGADAGNYSLTQPTATADITAKPITATGVAANNKVYDGNTAATLNTSTASLAGVISPDAVALVTAAASGAFADKNVGTGKTVTITGLTLGGGDAGNYSLSQPTAKADITAKPITVSGVAAGNKVYDGNTTASVSTAGVTLQGVVSGDSVSLVGGGVAGTFDTKNVGTGKTVTVTGLNLTGTDAGNYSVSSTATTTADVTPLGISASISAANKEYDGTTAATINSCALNGAVSGDAVSCTGGTAAFADKNAGNGKTVTATGVALSGADAGNYSLGSTATTTATITPRPLTIGATGINKQYDATASATVTLSDNRLGGDVLTHNYASASFADKNVGTGKSVSVSGITITGADAGNYTANTTATTTADITPLGITGSITASNKVYDATVAATITGRSLAGVLGADAVGYVGGTATFADKNAGTGKTVTATGLSLSGADAGNYTVNSTAATTADITPLAITATASASNKVYDATTAATITGCTPQGVLGSDAVSCAGGTATFADKNVGNGKTVTVTGLALSGADAGNYTVGTTTTTSASITPRGLVIGAAGVNKVYDATTAATVTLSDNRISGDVLTAGYASASFGDKNVGTGKTVSVSGITITGADAGNYNANTTATTAADITPLGITGSVTAANKVYDTTVAATITGRSLAGVLGADAVGYVGGTATFADKNVGTGKTVTATGLSLSGADAGNYTVNGTAATTADITPLGITGAITAANKVYDATVAATVTGCTVTGVLGGDVVSCAYGGGTFANKNVGDGKTVTATGLWLSGADAGNYSVNHTATTTASITPRPLTVAATAANKQYDGTTSVSVTLSDNHLAGDGVTDNYASAAFVSKNVATPVGPVAVNITGVSISGIDAPNYQLGSSTVSTSAVITPAPLAIGANNANKILSAPLSAVSYAPTYTSFVAGEGPSVLSGSLTFTTTATASSPVGTYPFTLAGVTSTNYSISFPQSTLNIVYATGGTCNGDVGHQILQPINWNGTSVFKQGSTQPAKFRVCDANGVSIGTAGVVSTFKLVQIAFGTTSDAVNETVLSTTPDAAFRWDSTAQQWIFNISSKSFTANTTYGFLITLNDGSTIGFQYGLK